MRAPRALRLALLGLFLLLFGGFLLEQRLGGRWFLWYAALASLFGFLLMAFDKRQARLQKERIPEAALHGVALLGGAPGTLLALYSLRHKSLRAAFRAGHAILVLLEAGLLGWLLGRG